MKPILIAQNCEVESAGSILDYLQQRGLDHRVVRTYNNESLPDTDGFSALISLGTPVSAADYFGHAGLEQLLALICRVLRADMPYLGVCFGGQILARALGGIVKPNPVREIGVYTVRLTEAGKCNRLFTGFPDQFEVFHWHGDTFRLPFEADLLVEGNDCRNQAFRKGRAVGYQFHLEVDARQAELWCEVYAEELRAVGKSVDDVLAEMQRAATGMHRLGFQLLDNFFSDITP